MPRCDSIAYSYRDDPAVPRFADDKALFVFDGVCVLCSGGASWLMRHDRGRQVRFTAAQDALGLALYAHYGMELNATYLVIIDGIAWTKSAGYLKLCALFGGPWQLLRIGALVPEPLRDRAYDLIARSRYRWFGKADHCSLLSAEQRSRLI